MVNTKKQRIWTVGPVKKVLYSLQFVKAGDYRRKVMRQTCMYEVHTRQHNTPQETTVRRYSYRNGYNYSNGRVCLGERLV